MPKSVRKENSWWNIIVCVDWTSEKVFAFRVTFYDLTLCDLCVCNERACISSIVILYNQSMIGSLFFVVWIGTIHQHFWGQCLSFNQGIIWSLSWFDLVPTTRLSIEFIDSRFYQSSWRQSGSNLWWTLLVVLHVNLQHYPDVLLFQVEAQFGLSLWSPSELASPQHSFPHLLHV